MIASRVAHSHRHYVVRLADEAEWLIHNDNVTFVSCPPDYTLGRYDERGFLSVPSPAPAEVE